MPYRRGLKAIDCDLRGASSPRPDGKRMHPAIRNIYLLIYLTFSSGWITFKQEAFYAADIVIYR